MAGLTEAGAVEGDVRPRLQPRVDDVGARGGVARVAAQVVVLVLPKD